MKGHWIKAYVPDGKKVRRYVKDGRGRFWARIVSKRVAFGDFDVECRRPLDDLLPGQSGFAGAEDDNTVGIAVLGATTDDSLLARVIQALSHEFAGGFDPPHQSGSWFFTPQYSSRAGENVLDLFGGSGSTLIAAEQTGRHAYLMELDALYCDVIVQRWEKFTGQKAQQISEVGTGA